MNTAQLAQAAEDQFSNCYTIDVLDGEGRQLGMVDLYHVHHSYALEVFNRNKNMIEPGHTLRLIDRTGVIDSFTK